MAVNILSLGTFLLLDTSLTLGDRREALLVTWTDTHQPSGHQVGSIWKSQTRLLAIHCFRHFTAVSSFFCSVFYLCEAFGQSLRRTIETPMPASSRIFKQACKHDTDMILAAPWNLADPSCHLPTVSEATADVKLLMCQGDINHDGCTCISKEIRWRERLLFPL